MSHRAVYKTTNAIFLDEFYSGVSRPREDAFADAVQLMEAPGSLALAARELEGRDNGLPDGSADDYQADWLGGSKQRAAQPVDRVLRYGYLAAVALAREQGVGIDNYWVTGAGDDFELHICEAADRVVVLMFVPDADARSYGSENASNRSWVVRAGAVDEVRADAPRVVLDDGDTPIVMTQVSGRLDARAQ